MDEDWRRLVSLAVTGAVLDEAVRVADKYVLQAYDAIHLASAITLRSSLEETILLASWDDELDAAATREGFSVLRDAAQRSSRSRFHLYRLLVVR